MRVERDPVRAHDRDRLATAAAGARLRLRHDLLAAPARLATGRRLAAAARTAARAASPVRPARPLACRLRLGHAARAFGGSKTGPSPVDRRKAGSKHHLITDASGVPLACLLTGANAHDVTQLLPLVEAILAIRGVVGRPRRRPTVLLADRGYDSQAHRQVLRTLGIRPLIARRKTAHGSGLGSQRWVVERILSWLHQHRRLRIRYERQAEIHEALLSLACSLICLRALRGSFC
jgi:transposase